MTLHRTVQLAQELYDLLTACADAEQRTIRAVANTLLREQLTAHQHADATTARTLLDVRGLREPVPPHLPLAFSAALVNAASDLAATWSTLTERTIRTSHVVRALLWHALAPARSRDPRPSPLHPPKAATRRTRTVALAPLLYRALSERATREHVPLLRLSETLLEPQLTPPGPRDAAVISALLAHDGLHELASSGTTVHLPTAVLDQAADFATRWSDALGRSVRTGQVLSALLWHALDPTPVAPAEGGVLSAPASDTFTVSVSDALNTRLRTLAGQRGESRDALVAALLSAQLDALVQARQAGQSGALLASPSARHRGVAMTTIRVLRSLDGRLRAEETMWATEERGTARRFRKGQIIEALLWRALDQHDGHDAPESEAPPTARAVIIDGAVYQRVQARALRERQRSGQTTTVRQLVNRYLDAQLRPEEEEGA